MAWDNWSATPSTSAHRIPQQVLGGTATGLLALCAAVGFVLLGVWLFRWAVLPPAVWGVLSPVLATVVSMALMGGLVWLTRVDRRSAFPSARRAARRARAAKKTHDATLSSAIATADSLALTTGGIWLDKSTSPADA